MARGSDGKKLYCGRCGYVLPASANACLNCGFAVSIEESSQKIDVASRLGGELARRRQTAILLWFICAVAFGLGILLLGSRSVSEGASIAAILEDPVGDLGLVMLFGSVIVATVVPFIFLKCPACEASMALQLFDMATCRSCGIHFQ